MSIEEAIEVLRHILIANHANVLEYAITKQQVLATAMACNALEAMKNIKKAESVEQAVEILNEYLDEVEV